jgi:sirohydrochlorin ferrochelatase
VIVDHGSRRAASNDALLAFCDVYRALQRQRQPGAASDGDSDPESSSSSSDSDSEDDDCTTTTTSVVVAVEPAHMELAEPTIEQAVGKCVAQGASRVVVAPFFLSRGRHIQEDIPALVEEARSKYQGVEVAVAEPLGADMEGLARILLANVEAAAVGGATRATP